MTAFEWVAVVGAAAWLPQIGVVIYRLIIKPKVKLIASWEPEVGYTTFGPILNVQFAFSASRKDAVIERITVVLRHERGQGTTLEWKTLQETFSQVRGAAGEVAQVGKSQLAIALKVSTAVLVEKFIGFQDTRFQEEQRVQAGAVQDRLNHLKKTEAHFAEQIVKTKELMALVDFFKNRFFWQEGKYEAAVNVYIAGRSKPIVQRFAFSLSADNVDRLRGNLPRIETVVKELAQELPTEKMTQQLWYWANPPFRPAES